MADAGSFAKLGPEFALVAACCRPLSQSDRLAAIADAATPTIDPVRVVQLARAHRVDGFVDQGVRAAGVSLGASAIALLAARAGEARALMLRNAGEEVRLAQALAAADVDALFVKGASLAMLAHGTLALKTAWDIDLLVAPNSLGKARRLLEQQGYRFSTFDQDDDPLIERTIAATHETLWLHKERRLAVELHRQLTQTPTMLAGVGIDSPRQAVTIAPGAVLTTLAPAPLLAFLAVHGAIHGWARLKWLADFAALAVRTDPAAMHEAADLGAGRSIALAAWLTQMLLGVDCGFSDGRAALAVHPTLLMHSRRQIAKTSLDRADAPLSIREKADFYRAGLALNPGLNPKWAYAISKLSAASSARRARLPNWLRPVDMAAVGIPVALWRGVRAGIKKRQAG